MIRTSIRLFNSLPQPNQTLLVMGLTTAGRSACLLHRFQRNLMVLLGDRGLCRRPILRRVSTEYVFLRRHVRGLLTTPCSTRYPNIHNGRVRFCARQIYICVNSKYRKSQESHKAIDCYCCCDITVDCSTRPV